MNYGHALKVVTGMLILFHSCPCFATSGRPTPIFMSYILMSFKASVTQFLRPTYQFLMRLKHHVYTLYPNFLNAIERISINPTYCFLMRVKHRLYVLQTFF